jgi:DinB superfamily
MNSSASTILVTSLLEMPSFMDSAFSDLKPEQLTVLPPKDKAPLAEHVWHVRDCEEELYAPRIRRVLIEENPYIEPMSVSHWPVERGYLAKPANQVTREFRALRENLVRLLRAAPAEAFDRRCRRSDGRSSSVADLIGELLEHDQDHRVRIAAILAQRVSSAA